MAGSVALIVSYIFSFFLDSGLFSAVLLGFLFSFYANANANANARRWRPVQCELKESKRYRHLSSSLSSRILSLPRSVIAMAVPLLFLFFSSSSFCFFFSVSQLFQKNETKKKDLQRSGGGRGKIRSITPLFLGMKFDLIMYLLYLYFL